MPGKPYGGLLEGGKEMFDKFGEFDSHTELNEAAAGQLEQKDYEALFELATPLMQGKSYL